MTPPEDDAREPETGAAGPSRDSHLAAWRRRWERGEPPPSPRRGPGLRGALAAAVRRLLGPLLNAAQRPAWERQRAYNLVLQEAAENLVALEERLEAERRDRDAALGRLTAEIDRLGRDLQSVQRELFGDIEASRRELEESLKSLHGEHWKYLVSHDERMTELERLRDEGWKEIMVHGEALFSRLDQKLDRYRGLSRERWSRLGALLETAREAGAPALARAVAEERYVEFEARFRGREEDIAARLEPYLEILAGRGEVLDLGCGRGEALEVLERHGLPCRGVDMSAEMVARCHAKGLNAEVGDLLDVLAAAPAGSLGGVVSFHVVEHLTSGAVDRLVRLAWRALEPGGVLVLETPSPLSLVVAARNFWIDPTHRRPLHPESLSALLELNGFDPVERIDLQPFSEPERLPDLAVGDLDPVLEPLARAVVDLRDHLDRLLYGHQDYGLVGYKPR